MEKLLTLPETPSAPLTVRAKALVFHDPGSLSLLGQVERIARSDATALVVGETGTGKELIARHIHGTSGRKGPFIAVNCGAFSESLIDAELFGHESGAFTGASQARAGWFEAANGGTLFLDEIGDLPMSLQVKLLRVLQERQVVRLGSRRSIPLDVRLVAATNIDLARAVEAQHFRSDLFYRLSVATLRLPPLRDRPADILPLARHFVSVYSARLKLTGIVLSEPAQAKLLAYSWPGNIRELENVIHFALIVCQGPAILEDDIKLVPLSGGTSGSAHALSIASAAPTAAQPPAPAAMPPLADPMGTSSQPPHGFALGPDSTVAETVDLLGTIGQAWQALLEQGHEALMDQIEALLVRTAFEHASQNQVKTAKAMGITRNMLRTLLKRHGLLANAMDTEGAESVIAPL
jgi:sigma-54 dependent transcriptional regulator